jgi:hypothetical protein
MRYQSRGIQIRTSYHPEQVEFSNFGVLRKNLRRQALSSANALIYAGIL